MKILAAFLGLVADSHAPGARGLHPWQIAVAPEPLDLTEELSPRACIAPESTNSPLTTAGTCLFSGLAILVLECPFPEQEAAQGTQIVKNSAA